VYDAFGVEVNALSVEEIFALYEHTGFLYPDKAARLFPTCRRCGKTGGECWAQASLSFMY